MAGCPFPDQLEASKFQAETCNLPTRDRGQLLSIVAYVLYGVAGLCLLARLTARVSSLGGSGYGWDDFMAVLCFAPLTALTVAIYYSVRYGEGRDVWTLGIGSIMKFHMVSTKPSRHYFKGVLTVIVVLHCECDVCVRNLWHQDILGSILFTKLEREIRVPITLLDCSSSARCSSRRLRGRHYCSVSANNLAVDPI